MADTASITIIKRFPYRGQQEEFSNTYHFTGSTPGSDAAWKTLADAIINAERNLMQANVQYVRAYGYEAGNEHSVSTIDYVALGGGTGLVTGASTIGQYGPGDSAVVLRALRAGKNSKGRNVYCFKYFHGVAASTSTPDVVPDIVKTAFVTFGNKMLDGTLPGNFKWTAPQAQALSNPQCLPFVTTRTLKRRGKRPSS